MATRATITAVLGGCLWSALVALVLLGQAQSAAADELSDFHAAVEQVTAQYNYAVATLDTAGRAETAAAVTRLRQSWQALGEQFTAHRPAALAHDTTLPPTFMQVDVRLVGVLLVIDMGNRAAARNALAPLGETLATLSARSAPPP